MERVLHVRVVEARNLRAADPNGKSDPYCVVKMRKARGKLRKAKGEAARRLGLKAVHRSEVQPRTLHPVWERADFTLAFSDFTEYVVVSLYDHDRLRDDFLGKVRVRLADLQQRPEVHRWFNLYDRKCVRRVQGQVNIRLRAAPLPPVSVPADRLPAIRSELLEFPSLVSRPEVALLTLRVGTWNMGNEPPPEADVLRGWLAGPGGGGGGAVTADVVVVGVQESQYDAGRKKRSAKADWFSSLAEVLGDEYACVASPSLREMRLSVHARREHLDGVVDVEADHVATGVGNVVGNKGAVAVSLRLGHTSFCFINCHLPAHQDRAARRAHNARAIVRGMDLGQRGMDILNQFHHVVWLGDLNYRLGYGGAGAAREPSREEFQSTVDAVRLGRLGSLAADDQLAEEMSLADGAAAFHGFSEGWIGGFAPTFKLVPGRADPLQYDPKRLPAWCDRVLWRSAPGHGGALRQLEYSSAPEVRSSDHTPVSALFEADTSLLASAVDPRRGPCTMKLVGLRARLVQRRHRGAGGGTGGGGFHGSTVRSLTTMASARALPSSPRNRRSSDRDASAIESALAAAAAAAAAGGSADAAGGGEPPPSTYLKFSGPFCVESRSTAVARRSFAPAWDDQPTLRSRCNSVRRLREEFICVRVMQYDPLRTKRGHVMAQGQISLTMLDEVVAAGGGGGGGDGGGGGGGGGGDGGDADARDTAPVVWQSAAFPFRCELTRGGRHAGTLEGTLQIYWDVRADSAASGRVEHHSTGRVTMLTCRPRDEVPLQARRRFSIFKLSANLLATPAAPTALSRPMTPPANAGARARSPHRRHVSDMCARSVPSSPFLFDESDRAAGGGADPAASSPRRPLSRVSARPELSVQEEADEDEEEDDDDDDEEEEEDGDGVGARLPPVLHRSASDEAAAMLAAASAAPAPAPVPASARQRRLAAAGAADSSSSDSDDVPDSDDGA